MTEFPTRAFTTWNALPVYLLVTGPGRANMLCCGKRNDDEKIHFPDGINSLIGRRLQILRVGQRSLEVTTAIPERDVRTEETGR